ncbi:hypothetical protein PIB30_058251 [Stylosanthes scabra]|uniref:Uncharacterized protein n=1 Tax=Stylosanthes scabra TaxID=79078 RepID=A0ABU6YL39_9FABA|nr:hypothetical protein [Stylosanthes scabra]
MLEFMSQLQIALFSFFQQSLLLCGHGFCPFHRLCGDLYFPSLSLEELSQGSFQLLDTLVWGYHSLLRGKLGDAVVSTLVVELSVHHLQLGGLAFVSRLDSKVYSPQTAPMLSTDVPNNDPMDLNRERE